MSVILFCVGMLTIAISIGCIKRSAGVRILIYAIGCLMTEWAFIDYYYDTYECKILADHIDKDKTRVIKENDEVKELFITVDGKEYHFTFKERLI